MAIWVVSAILAVLIAVILYSVMRARLRKDDWTFRFMVSFVAGASVFLCGIFGIQDWVFKIGTKVVIATEPVANREDSKSIVDSGFYYVTVDEQLVDKSIEHMKIYFTDSVDSVCVETSYTQYGIFKTPERDNLLIPSSEKDKFEVSQ